MITTTDINIYISLGVMLVIITGIINHYFDNKQRQGLTNADNYGIMLL